VRLKLGRRPIAVPVRERARLANDHKQHCEADRESLRGRQNRTQPTHDARNMRGGGSPFSLPSVSNTDIQSQRLLTNSTFTTLRQLGDFGDRGLTLRVRFQVANVFFRPGNPLAASICYLALHSHDFLPSMLSYSRNKQFGFVLDGVGLVNSSYSTNCHVGMQLAVT